MAGIIKTFSVRRSIEKSKAFLSMRKVPITSFSNSTALGGILPCEIDNSLAKFPCVNDDNVSFLSHEAKINFKN